MSFKFVSLKGSQLDRLTHAVSEEEAGEGL